MKAATSNKHCFSGPGGNVRGGKSGRTLASHAPRRHAVAHHCAAGLPGQDGGQPAGGIDGGAAAQGAKAQGGKTIPRVLHVDSDSGAAAIVTALLVPEATVVHVATLAEARRLLCSEIFSLCILDPRLSDGDGGSLLPALSTTPLLVYSARQPDWRDQPRPYLPKPWTSPRQLWNAVSAMLGLAPAMSAGD